MKRRRHPGERGFTLIELLAVMTIIGILAVALATGVNMYIDRSRITACQANMREVQQMLAMMQTKKSLPSEGGVALFYDLWMKSGVEQTPKTADRFNCSAFNKKYLEAWIDPDTGELYEDPRSVWGHKGKGRKDEENLEIRDRIRQNGRFYSAYRVINLPKIKPTWSKLLSGHTPIIADGNPLVDDESAVDAECNHGSLTNVCYGDGSIKEIEWDSIDELAGLEGAERFQVVGPNAPHAEKGSIYELFKYLVFSVDENN